LGGEERGAGGDVDYRPRAKGCGLSSGGGAVAGGDRGGGEFGSAGVGGGGDECVERGGAGGVPGGERGGVAEPVLSVPISVKREEGIVLAAGHVADGAEAEIADGRERMGEGEGMGFDAGHDSC